MKKISLFALAFATGFVGMAQNQDANRTPILRTEMSVQPRFGLRGGVSMSKLELDDDYSGTAYDMSKKTTFHAGAFVNIPVGGMFRIQPEISYYGGGSKVHGNLVSNPLITSGTGNYELDFHYVGLPIMFQLQTPGGFFVEAGPQGAFLVKGQEEVTNGAKTDLKEKELVKQLDFGAAGGIGYLSRIGLGINARYYHGLSNVFNSDNAAEGSEAREISTRSLQIGLVYHFGANK
jgi:hypothetical protein